MLDRSQTRTLPQGVVVVELTIAATRSLAEGTLMVHKVENGKGKVEQSSGTKNERYAGFALMRPGNVDRLVEIYNTQVKEDGTIDLKHKANIADMRADIVNADKSLTPLELLAAGDAADGKAVVTDNGNALKVVAANAGKVVRIAAAFVPTFQEAQQAYGAAINGQAPSQIGATSLISGANQLVGTDMIDMTANWNAIDADGNPPALYSAAGGRVTTKPGGAELTNVVLVQAPSTNSPFALFRLL